MAIIELTVNSSALGLSTGVTVCFPENNGSDTRRGLPCRYKPGIKYQALWLLTGGGGDSSEWARHTNIERYSAEKNLIVITPATFLSLYTDMYYGEKYFTYITEELPRIMRWMLPISEKREDNFVAGFSMGGYGAYKWAMANPEAFAAVGSFGGAMDIVSVVKASHLRDGVLDRDFQLAFGTIQNLEGSINDDIYMAGKQAEANAGMPRFFMSVGKDDFTYSRNIETREKLLALGFDVTWDTGEGTHSYEYCDGHIRTFLNWAGLKGTPIYGKEI
jgi:S-formylglutathione hydrolase FrmB